MEYSSAIDKNEIMPFAVTWMNLDRAVQSKVSQTTIPGYHLYVESKIQMILSMKQTHKDDRYVVADGERTGASLGVSDN